MYIHKVNINLPTHYPATLSPSISLSLSLSLSLYLSLSLFLIQIHSFTHRIESLAVKGSESCITFLVVTACCHTILK